MAKRISNQKTLIVQIFDELFSNIEKEKEFDEELIQELKNLTENNNLTNSAKIVKAIKLSTGKDFEDT